MKSFIKYLLFLSILLLAGYGLVNAYTSQKSGCTAEEKTEHTLDATGNEFFLRSATSDSERQNPRFAALLVENKENEEEDDDELSSFRKRFDNGNLTTSSFFFERHGYNAHLHKQGLAFGKHFSNSSLHRYLVLQVFRI